MLRRLLALSPFIKYTQTHRGSSGGGRRRNLQKQRGAKSFCCCIRKDLCEIRTQLLGRGWGGAPEKGPSPAHVSCDKKPYRSHVFICTCILTQESLPLTSILHLTFNPNPENTPSPPLLSLSLSLNQSNLPHKQFPLQGFSPRGKTCDPEHSKKTKKKENTGTVTTPALDYVPTFLFGTHFFKSVHTSPSSCFWATVRVICSLQRRVKKHWRTVRRDATKKQTRVLASDERKP